MQFRVKLLRRNLAVGLELTANTHSADGAIALVAGFQWPPEVNALQIVDLDSREVYPVSRGELR